MREQLIKIINEAETRGDKETAQKALLKLESLSQSEQNGTKRNKTEQVEPPKDGLGRVLGLTGRYGLEGLAEVADIGTEPVRQVLNSLPNVDINQSVSQAVKTGLDDMGVPKPIGDYDNLAAQGSKFLAGGGGMMGLSKKVANAANATTKAVGTALSKDPILQGTTAVSAGLGGEYAKQEGASPLVQLVASLGAGFTPMGLKSAGKAGINYAKNFKTQIAPQQVETVLNKLNIDLNGLPQSIANNIKARIEYGLKTNNLDEVALKRLGDYAQTNTTATKGTVTLDPMEITQQKNLAKIGANSSDPNVNKLARVENDNMEILKTGLDDVANGTQQDLISGGEAVIKNISGRNNQLKQIQNNLYKVAQDKAGREISLSRSDFIQKVDDNLRKSNKNAFLPDEIKKMINEIAYGQKNLSGETHQIPFNVNAIDQLETILATAQRGAKDGNVKAAIGAVKKALMDTPIEGQASSEAMKAFRNARAFSAKLYKWQESTPAIKAIIDGVEPDKFMQTFIIGSTDKSSFKNVGKLVSQLKKDPQALNIVRNQMAAWIKNKALSGNNDETANLSAKGLKNALDAIGDRKMKLFFTPKDLNQLKAIQRVASYETFQPRGSSVNNSNTMTTGAGMFFKWLASKALKLPFGEGGFSRPVNNILDGGDAKKALNFDVTKQVPQAATTKSQPLAVPMALGANNLLVN